MNIVFLASTIFCLGAILYIGLKLAKKQPVPKNYLKLFISILLGVFSFTIEFPFRDTAVKIAILPLGVWILFMLLRKKEGAWERYRKFAWLGFFSNYLFLVSSFLVTPIHQWIYPPEHLLTYMRANDEIEVEPIHPSATQSIQLIENLQQSLKEFESETFNAEEFYYDAYFDETLTNIERFPYVIVGQLPKLGSDIKASIYVEQDGKGLLVSTTKTQYYFRSEHSILKEGNDEE